MQCGGVKVSQDCEDYNTVRSGGTCGTSTVYYSMPVPPKELNYIDGSKVCGKVTVTCYPNGTNLAKKQDTAVLAYDFLDGKDESEDELLEVKKKGNETEVDGRGEGSGEGSGENVR